MMVKRDRETPWRPPDECDSAVRGWMEKQGWPVTATHSDLDRHIYAWRHDVAGECHTLWITRRVIEDIAPLTLVEALNSWKVAEKLREHPDAYTLVRKSSPTSVVVEQRPGTRDPVRTRPEPRSLAEMVARLRAHVRLLEQYAQKAFREGDADYLGEIADKLRVLVIRSPSNKPWLIRLMEEVGDVELPPAPQEGPQAGDELTLEEYLQLDAVGVRVPSGSFEMLTNSELIRAWAQQAGASHEGWEMSDTLRAVLSGGVAIGGLPAEAAALKSITNAVLNRAKRFLASIDDGTFTIDAEGQGK
jgi:hypothetical protein